MPPTHPLVLKTMEELSLTKSSAEEKDGKFRKAVADLPMSTVCAL